MSSRPTAGDYIENIKTSAPKVVEGIKELAAAELKPAIKHAGLGSGLLSGAVVFAFGAAKLLFLAGGFALSVFFFYVAQCALLVSLTLGFLTMAVLLLLGAVLFILIGKSQIKKVKAPTQTIDEIKAAVSAVSESVSAGSQDAKLGVVDRQGAVQTKTSTKTSEG